MAEVVLSSRSFAVELLHLYDDYIILFLLSFGGLLMEAESHDRLLEVGVTDFIYYLIRKDMTHKRRKRDYFGEVYVVVYSFLHARDTLLKALAGALVWI